LLAVAAASETKRQQAEAFAAALLQVDVRAEILLTPEKTHASLNRDLGKTGEAATDAVMTFVESIRNKS
jgi:hypothetical protein